MSATVNPCSPAKVPSPGIVPVTYADVISSTPPIVSLVLVTMRVASPADYEQVLKDAGKLLLQEQRKRRYSRWYQRGRVSSSGLTLICQSSLRVILTPTDFQVLKQPFDEEFLNVPSDYY